MGEHQGMGEGDTVQLQYRPRHAVGRLCGAAACGQGPKKLLQLWQWWPPTTLACLAAGACINKERKPTGPATCWQMMNDAVHPAPAGFDTMFSKCWDAAIYGLLAGRLALEWIRSAPCRSAAACYRAGEAMLLQRSTG